MVRRLSQCKKSYCNECLEAIKWEKIMNIFIELQERFEYNQLQCCHLNHNSNFVNSY